ncbi:lyase [Budviciaceae bacterium CWB-B4]|uniref:Lyase n=1 Tax=Limnobaculum xujianqingii TaxID=2738837 RepID=A0A9D7AHT1_9GAMM|nr:HEAT repeat domain-containing protein [Limnobaculum xujianqingii]MBK5072969.1 lyase [Limnobaculum xujianqingii]MBK5176278.1 lyase [Limnobaculum xujianqingii]
MSKNRYQAKKEEKEILLFSKYKKASNDILVTSLSSSNSMEQLAAARELQLRGGEEVIQLANTFCQSSDYRKRKLGVFILGQISLTSEKEEQAVFDILTKLATEDKSAIVRSTAIESMAHRYNKNNLFSTSLIKHCFMTFNNKSVYARRATAFALSSVNDEKTIPLLVSLCNDKNDEVKNWAAFAINSNKYDTKEIRDCFFEMLSDSNSEMLV